jgi:hypothetical protein
MRATGFKSVFIATLVVALSASMSATTAQSLEPRVSAVGKQVAAAKSMLKKLAILQASSADYDRTGQFGDAWVDVDNDGCDTRNDILERDLTKEVYKDSCLIATGVLKDPYTGRTINFVRGVGTSTKVQIDHVIPLHLAWQYGATKWSFGKRVAFANDPINLIATDGPTNGQKSDSGPDEWLPPNKSYQCTYVIRFIRVAYLYKVGVTSRMKSTMSRTLNSCTKVVGSPATLTPLSRASWDRAAAIG